MQRGLTSNAFALRKWSRKRHDSTVFLEHLGEHLWDAFWATVLDGAGREQRQMVQLLANNKTTSDGSMPPAGFRGTARRPALPAFAAPGAPWRVQGGGVFVSFV